MKNLALWGLSTIWLFALLNPVLKKFDYGAGYPVVGILAIGLGILAIWKWRERFSRSGEQWVGAAFLVMITLSWVFSEAWAVGFSDYLAFSAAIILYLWLGFGQVDWKNRFLRVVMWGTGMALLIGFLLYIFLDEVRMIGPFFNKLTHAHTWPNAFALYLILTWPLGFLIERRWLRVAYLSFALAALFLTFSRGALIVGLGQVLLLLCAKKWRWKEALAVLSLIVVIVLGANFARGLNFPLVDVGEKVAFEADEGDQSKADRLVFWKGGLDLALERPFLGWGPFSFREAYNGIEEQLLQTADHPHNFYLKLAAEYGFPALILFLILLGTNFAAARKKRDMETLVLGVAVLGALAHNMIDYNLNFLANLLLLVVYLAFMRSGSGKKTVGLMWLKVLMVILAVLALYDAGMQVLQKPEYELYPRASLSCEEGILRNKLDAEAYYCEGNFEKAIELNPLNEFKYYRAALENGDERYLERSLALLEQYFVYVKYNRNFTDYTTNVEEASRLIDLIVERDPGKVALREKQAEMWADANHARANKDF